MPRSGHGILLSLTIRCSATHNRCQQEGHNRSQREGQVTKAAAEDLGESWRKGVVGLKVGCCQGFSQVVASKMRAKKKTILHAILGRSHLDATRALRLISNVIEELRLGELRQATLIVIVQNVDVDVYVDALHAGVGLRLGARRGGLA